jgi:shikimate dehydrogenase
MQRAGFAAAGLDWTYELLDVDPKSLKQAVKSLRADDVAGANVTIPHKVAVMAFLDSMEGDAIRAQAVNSIKNDGGRLVGDNTDVAAIRAAVGEAGVDPAGASVVILGAGGSARAAAVALKGASLTFVARDPLKVDLAGDVIAWSDPAWLRLTRKADLLLNATPLGRNDEMPLRPGGLPRSGAVIDLVYVESGTPLIRKARSLGLRTCDGWFVLLAQGALAFEWWTGVAAPRDRMRETLPS